MFEKMRLLDEWPPAANGYPDLNDPVWGRRAPARTDLEGSINPSSPLVEARIEKQALEKNSRSGGPLSAVYCGVFLFCFVFFFRPEDFVPGVASVPFAKIAGLFTAGALAITIGVGRVRLSAEIKLLLLLYGYLCLCIPGSTWPGGSADLVFNGFLKFILIVIATMYAVTTASRLRRLMLVQTFAMLTMSLLALNQTSLAGRMYGVGAMFGDPNDFALNLCIILPFCVAMLLAGRRWFSNVFWSIATILAILTIVSTYSRGGFLALVAVLITMWWQFRIKGKTAMFAVLLTAISLIGAISFVGSSSYVDRLKSIVDPQSDSTGSAEARRQLLIRSVQLTMQHPVFGVGPGQFAEMSKAWHESHNSYTQLSAEAGIPSLLIFLLLMRRAFTNLKLKSSAVNGSRTWYLAKGLYCSMVGYLVGAFFLSTAYWFVPYLLVAYTAALARISPDSDAMFCESKAQALAEVGVT